MTVTRNRWRIVACALVALAAVCALGPGCDLNPQPLPPGSGFSTGNPVVTPEMDATTASSSGGSSSGGGLELSPEGGYAASRDGSAPEASPEGPPDGESSDAGTFVDAETDAPASDGEAGADSGYDAPEGE